MAGVNRVACGLRRGISSGVAVVLVGMGWGVVVRGQDVHFSQYFDAPIYVNPAVVGAHPGKARFTLSYKDQWRAIPAPYSTFAFAADMPFLQDRFGRGDYAGAGLLVYYDMAGKTNLGFQTTEIRLMGGYSKALGMSSRISAGIALAYTFRGLRAEDARVPDQWNGVRYDENLPINETFSRAQYVDMGIGVAFMGTPSDQLRYMVGLSVFHPFRPDISVVEQEVARDKLWYRWGFHGQLGYSLSDRFSVLPGLWFWMQGPHMEMVASALVRYMLSEPRGGSGLRHSIGGGVGYRFGDALYPVIRYEIQDFVLSVSYDITLSPLRQVNKFRGGLEVMLSYVLGAQDRYQSRSPRF